MPAAGSDLSTLKGEYVSISPNGNYAVYSRITASEWVKNSWRIPLYPFLLVIGRHNWSLTTNFDRKCTIVDGKRKDLFKCPGGGRPIWSPDGNRVAGNGGATTVLLLPENKSAVVPAPANARSLWFSNNVLLFVYFEEKSGQVVISTFDISTNAATEMGRAQPPTWVRGTSGVALCGSSVRIGVWGEYKPPEGYRRGALNWDFQKNALIDAEDIPPHGDQMKCAGNR